jgi:hypothetical protein
MSGSVTYAVVLQKDSRLGSLPEGTHTHTQNRPRLWAQVDSAAIYILHIQHNFSSREWVEIDLKGAGMVQDPARHFFNPGVQEEYV